MPISPSGGRGRKPPEDPKLKRRSREVEPDELDDEDILGQRDDVNPSAYDDDDDAEAEKTASAFKVSRKKDRAKPTAPPPPNPFSIAEDEDDEDEDEDEKPRVAPTKEKKPPSKKPGSSKTVIIALVILMVIGGGGFAVWQFVLPALSDKGDNSVGIITVVAPSNFMDFGTSETLQLNLDAAGYTLRSFISSSREVARASGISPATSAIVVSTQEALNKHVGNGTTNIAAFNTPLVFAMKQQTANELKEYGVITVDPSDGSLVMHLDKLMVEAARGAPYKLSGPDLSTTDMGNLLWCLMNSSMAFSGLDEQVQLAVLNNIRLSIGVESASYSTFRSLAEDIDERRIIAVPESAVVLDSGTNPEAWEDFSQNSLVIAYPQQSTVLSYHVVVYDDNGTAWFNELKSLNAESLFDTYGLRPNNLEAPHLGTVRLQAGLKQTISPDTVMPSVDRFKELMSMLGS